MSRVRISRSQATAQAIFVFAVTVSLYAALLVLHTELSGEQSSMPMQLNMVTSRSNVAFGGGSRTHEVGDNAIHVINRGAVHQPPEVSQESREIVQRPQTPGHGQLGTIASADASKLRGIPAVLPVAAQTSSTPSPASQITNHVPANETGKKAPAAEVSTKSQSEAKSGTTTASVKLETEKQSATSQVLPQEPAKTESAKRVTEAGGPGAAVQDSTLKPSRSIIRYDESWKTELLLSKLLQTTGPCSKHVPAGDEAMLVRMCCELTEAKVESIRRYSKQLRDADLWVLYDFRAMGEAEIVQLEERFRKLQVDHAFSVFMYNSKLAERLYPGSREKLESLGSQVNLAIHDVSVAAWWRTCAKHKWGDEVSGPKSRPLPKAVWSIESDAAFSGDVMAFLGYYRTYDEHLVVGWVDKAKEEWVVEKYKQMPKMSVLPHNVVYGKPNAVARMSARFLYHLDAALRANFVLHGEMYSSTLCRGVFADWCTVRPLIDGPFYSPEPGGLLSLHLLSDEEWEKANSDAGRRNRWYHPVARLKDPTTAIE